MFAIADRQVSLHKGLPCIRGADGQHEVGCFDITFDRPAEFPTPAPQPRVNDEVLEQGRKVFADMIERQGSSPCRDAGPGDEASTVHGVQ